MGVTIFCIFQNNYATIYNNKNFVDLTFYITRSTSSRFSYSFIMFIFINDILACTFIFLGYLSHTNWINTFGLANLEFRDLYIASIYFNWAGIFTIGYGDLQSVS